MEISTFEILERQRIFCKTFLQCFKTKIKRYETLLKESGVHTTTYFSGVSVRTSQSFDDDIELVLQQNSAEPQCRTFWKIGGTFSVVKVFDWVWNIVRRTKAARILSHLDYIPASDVEALVTSVAMEISVAYEYQLAMLCGMTEVILLADHGVSCVLTYLNSADACLTQEGLLSAILEVKPQTSRVNEDLPTRGVDFNGRSFCFRWKLHQVFKQPGLRILATGTLCDSEQETPDKTDVDSFATAMDLGCHRKQQIAGSSNEINDIAASTIAFKSIDLSLVSESQFCYKENSISSTEEALSGTLVNDMSHTNAPSTDNDLPTENQSNDSSKTVDKRTEPLSTDNGISSQGGKQCRIDVAMETEYKTALSPDGDCCEALSANEDSMVILASEKQCSSCITTEADINILVKQVHYTAATGTGHPSNEHKVPSEIQLNTLVAMGTVEENSSLHKTAVTVTREDDVANCNERSGDHDDEQVTGEHQITSVTMDTDDISNSDSQQCVDKSMQGCLNEAHQCSPEEDSDRISELDHVELIDEPCTVTDTVSHDLQYSFYGCFTPFGAKCNPHIFGFRGPLHYRDEDGSAMLMFNDLVTINTLHQRQIEANADDFHQAYKPKTRCIHYY